MADSTGFRRDLFGGHLVVAVGACFVRDGLVGLARLAVAVGAIHPIFGDMQIVAEPQAVFFLVASGQQQGGSRGDDHDEILRFHSLTSSDVRIW